jgi:hypothetical protein
VSEEVSALDIADQIWAIWAMAKRGEDPNEGAIRGLGEMIGEFTRQGGELSEIAYPLGLIQYGTGDEPDDEP